MTCASAVWSASEAGLVTTACYPGWAAGPSRADAEQRGDACQRALVSGRDDARAPLEVEWRRRERAGRVRERDDRARLANNQLGGRDVDRAPTARAQTRDGVDTAVGQVAESEREGAEHADALGDARHGCSRRDEVLGPRRLQRHELETLLRARFAERGAVDARSTAAAGDPLLAVAEVVDVAERDVCHRRAVGDRDRERIDRKPALRIEAAVDRIDDDAPAATAAVAALADLLGEHGEFLSGARECVEHGQRRVFGRSVDRDGQVAPGAASELVRPPRPRHGAHGRGDAVAHGAADLEPALGRHGSNGSSWLKTMPSRIFGKKNVDFGGMVSPASATAWTSDRPGAGTSSATAVRGGAAATSAAAASALCR